MDCQASNATVRVKAILGIGEPTNLRRSNSSARKPISSHRMTGRIMDIDRNGFIFKIGEGTDGRGPIVEARRLFLNDKYDVEVKPNKGDLVHYSLGPFTRETAHKVHLREREVIITRKNSSGSNNETKLMHPYSSPEDVEKTLIGEELCKIYYEHPISRGRPDDASIDDSLKNYIEERGKPMIKPTGSDKLNWRDNKRVNESSPGLEELCKRLNDQLFARYMEIFKSLYLRIYEEKKNEYNLSDHSNMNKESFYEIKTLRQTVREFLHKLAFNDIHITTEELIAKLQKEDWEERDRGSRRSDGMLFTRLVEEKKSLSAKSDGPIAPLARFYSKEIYPASKAEHEGYNPQQTVIDGRNYCESIAFTMSEDEENDFYGRPVLQEEHFESLKMHPYKAMMRHHFRESLQTSNYLKEAKYNSLKYCRETKDHIIRAKQWPVSKYLTEKEAIKQGRNLNNTNSIFFRNIPRDWMFAFKEVLVHRAIEEFGDLQIVKILMFPQKPRLEQEEKKYLTLAIEFRDIHKKWAAMKVKADVLRASILPENQPYFQPSSVRETGHYVAGINLLARAVAFTMRADVHPRVMIEKLGLKGKTSEIEIYPIRDFPKRKRVIASIINVKDREALEKRLNGLSTLSEKELDKFYLKHVYPLQTERLLNTFDEHYKCEKSGPTNGFMIYWPESNQNIQYGPLESFLRHVVKVRNITDIYGLAGYRAIHVTGEIKPTMEDFWGTSFMYIPDAEDYVNVEITRETEIPPKSED